MGRRPLSEWIEEQDHFSRLKHEHFRRAAEAIFVIGVFHGAHDLAAALEERKAGLGE